MQESEEIMAKTSKFENTLMDIADFVDSNVYLRSIKDAFTDYVPFIIAGSFGSLLNALIASQTTAWQSGFRPSATWLRPSPP